MTYRETLEELIDELEDIKPFLNRDQRKLLANYYKLLAEEKQNSYDGPVKKVGIPISIGKKPSTGRT